MFKRLTISVNFLSVGNSLIGISFKNKKKIYKSDNNNIVLIIYNNIII